MIVRRLDEIIGTERDVQAPTWCSRRLVLANDKVGFSLHETTLYAGTTTDMWYANHIEGVYVIEGTGELLDKATGEKHKLEPGVMYLLNDHDKHAFTAHTDVRTVCVFNPPVTGAEVHDENGVYPLITEDD